MVELVKARMRDDHHAAHSSARFVAVRIEVIAESHNLYQQWVLAPNTRCAARCPDSGDQNIALAFTGSRICW
ncbi:MAG: hypothetical protein IPJ30_23985 [Acidobacteria bacterium]|nr:hypothetical protein [Acidobacteriota bacterium]